MDQAIAGLIGVCLGFGLNEIATRIRSFRQEQQRNKAIRILLNVEIDENLELLSTYKANMEVPLENDSLATILDKLATLPKDSEERKELRDMLLWVGDQITIIPCPIWIHQVWDSQLTYLPDTLSIKELRLCQHFYKQLNRVTQLQESLLRLKTRYQDSFGKGYGLLVADKYNDLSPGFASELGAIVDDILKQANPVLIGISKSKVSKGYSKDIQS